MMFARAGDCTCHELIHPWSKNCVEANWMLLGSSIVGSYKFYAVLYVVRKLNQMFFKFFERLEYIFQKECDKIISESHQVF
jgi:hypothetical protein